MEKNICRFLIKCKLKTNKKPLINSTLVREEIKKEIKEEIRKYFELNENEKILQKIFDGRIMLLRSELGAPLQHYMFRLVKKISQFNDLDFHFKKQKRRTKQIKISQ